MSFFALNLVLALIWVLLTAELSLAGMIVGFLLGFVAIAIARPTLGSHRYVRSVAGIVKLIAVFFYKLVAANLLLARDILRPHPRFTAGFVAIDARDLSPLETVLFTNLVSLTPGTIVVDLDAEGHTLWVHALYAAEPELIRRDCALYARLIREAAGDEPADGGPA